MDNVLDFPASTTLTPEQALLSALDVVRAKEVSDVIVIGYLGDDLLVRSSRMSRQTALWLSECLRQHVMEPTK